MIRINLAPPDELENPLWWVMDAAVLILVASIGYLGVQVYLNTIRGEMTNVKSDQSISQQEIERLKPEQLKYDQYTKKLSDLNSTINSIRGIAISRTTRYRPVIIMEHMQTLKPYGVWLSQMVICNDPKEFGDVGRGAAGCGGGGGDSSGQESEGKGKASRISLTGSAMDNILVAEFLTALISTKTQEIDETDLRTQVVFENVTLRFTQQKSGGNESGKGSVYNFEIVMNVLDRERLPSSGQQLSWLLHPEKMLFSSLASNFKWK